MGILGLKFCFSHRWRRDNRGVVALETAIVGSTFLLLALFLVDLGLRLFWRETLDTVALLAARQIQIGQAQQTNNSAAMLMQNIICPPVSSALNCNNITLHVQAMPTDFYDADYSVDIGASTYCAAAPNQTVLVQLDYMAPLFMTRFYQGTAQFNGQTVVPISVAIPVGTEPFDASLITGGAPAC